MEWDAHISKKLRIDNGRGWLKKIAAFFAHSGDSWFWVLGLLIIYIFFPPLRQTALRYISSILSLAVLVLAIKFLVRRQRPQGEWGAIYRRTDPHSFPSGHAARATLLAVLGLGWGPPLWGGSLLVWAPLVCVARVALGLHYFSDILAGAVLGGLAGVLSLWWFG
ncbi:MAG: phosphatase PAP2 family protein [Anaerolineales bacterium]